MKKTVLIILIIIISFSLLGSISMNYSEAFLRDEFEYIKENQDRFDFEDEIYDTTKEGFNTYETYKIADSIVNGNVIKAKKLLDMNEELINETNVNNFSFFSLAAKTYKADNMMKMLLRKGIDPNILTNRGISPLMIYLFNSNRLDDELISLLKENNMDFNVFLKKDISDDYYELEGSNLLHYCFKDDYSDSGYGYNFGFSLDRVISELFQEDEEEIVTYNSDFLIEAGVDVNKQNRLGITPLHLAIITENLHQAKELLENGANPTLRCDIEFDYWSYEGSSMYIKGNFDAYELITIFEYPEGNDLYKYKKDIEELIIEYKEGNDGK